MEVRNAYAIQGSLRHTGGGRGRVTARYKCRRTKRDGGQRSHTARRQEGLGRLRRIGRAVTD
jgi:hypothetical protein